MRMTACTTPVLSRARSSSHITRNFTVLILPARSTNPRQRVPDQHVYHAGAAELGVHYDHPRGLLANLPDDLGILATLDTSQGLQRDLRRFRSDDGEEFAFVGDVEWVYTQDLARPVHDVPDRELVFPKRDPVSRVAGELVQDRPHTATCRVTHEAQPRPRGILDRSDQRSKWPGVRKHLGLELQVAAGYQDGRPVIAYSARAEDLVPWPHRSCREGEPRVRDPHPCSDDVEPVALAALDHLGVSRGDGDPGPSGGARHRFYLAAQRLGLKALLDDEGGREPYGGRPGDSQVVHRPVDRELADGSPGEDKRAHNEGVGS